MTQKPTNSEIEILTVLWETGAGTTRQVHDIIAKNKSVGYTSTLKTIQNMLDKGFVSRIPKG
ncbi:MAG: BlaI/MecI/CopY family transcriptional regulator, partial [Bacteroidota bacterium]